MLTQVLSIYSKAETASLCVVIWYKFMVPKNCIHSPFPLNWPDLWCWSLKRNAISNATTLISLLNSSGLSVVAYGRVRVCSVVGIHKSIKSHNSESGQSEFKTILIRMTKKKKWPCNQTYCLLSFGVLQEHYSLLFSPCNAFFTGPVQTGPLSPLLWLNSRQTFFGGEVSSFLPPRWKSSGGKSRVVQTEWACDMRWWLFFKNN